jgi:hypothetical protein
MLLNMAHELVLEKSTYRPGETVKGNINLTYLRSHKLHNLVMYAYGEERADIYIKGDGAKNAVDIERRLISTFFKRDLNMFLNQLVIVNNNSGDELASDSNVFPFEFTLPNDVPESYEGENVRIVYRVTLKSKGGWISRYKKELPFYVVHNELNDKRKVTGAPIIFKSGNQFSSYVDCFKNEGVELSVDLHKLEYHPGEDITGQLSLKNFSSRRMRRIKFDLLGIELVDSIPEKERIIEEYAQEDRSIEDETILFTIHIPPRIKRSYVAKHSAYYWLVRVKFDIRLGKDIFLGKEIKIV